MRRTLVAFGAVSVLAGCASDDGSPSKDAVGSSAESSLQITVDAGNGAGPENYTLVCDGQDGAAHPDAEAACSHLEAADDPFAPLADDAVCTQQYGGPETASIVGRWEGEPVDLELARSNGCLIAQWDALGPVLPAA